MLVAAFEKLESGQGDASHLNGLVKTADYFFARMLPHGKALAEEIEAGSETMMALTAEEF
jgi:hypothetical protein